MLFSFQKTQEKRLETLKKLYLIKDKIIDQNQTRKIPPDPKWSQFRTAKEIEAPAGSELKIGWRVTMPREEIIPITGVMINDTIQKILLRYPNKEVAKCFNFDNIGKNFKRLECHPLPNDNLYPIESATLNHQIVGMIHG